MGAGLASALLAHLAFELDVHAHPAAAEVEHLLKRELQLGFRAVVRDEKSTIVHEPHVRLDLVTSERQSLLE